MDAMPIRPGHRFVLETRAHRSRTAEARYHQQSRTLAAWLDHSWPKPISACAGLEVKNVRADAL